MGIRVSAWSLGSKAIPRIPSWKEYIRKELKPVIDNSKQEMLDWGQMNVTQFSLDTFHIKVRRELLFKVKKTCVTSPLNKMTGGTTTAYLHRRDGHCAGCSQWCRHTYVCFQMWADRAASNHHYLTDRHSYLRETAIKDNMVMNEIISLKKSLWRQLWTVVVGLLHL